MRINQGPGAVHCLRGLFTNHVIESRAEIGILAAWNRSPSAASPTRGLKQLMIFPPLVTVLRRRGIFWNFLPKIGIMLYFMKTRDHPANPTGPRSGGRAASLIPSDAGTRHRQQFVMRTAGGVRPEAPGFVVAIWGREP